MASTIEPTSNPSDTKDMWWQVRQNERVTNYQHYNGDNRYVSPYFVHDFAVPSTLAKDHPAQQYAGQRIGWDVLNKCFRPVTDGNWDAGESGKEYSGWFREDLDTYKELRLNKKVNPTQFIMAYREEYVNPRFEEPCLEGLIARLMYFKNSMTGIRTYITKVNSIIRKDIVPRKLGPESTPEQREKAVLALYLDGLASGCSLSRPRTKTDESLGDYESLFAGTPWE
jgi:hypothetical protein